MTKFLSTIAARILGVLLGIGFVVLIHRFSDWLNDWINKRNTRRRNSVG